MAIHKLLIGSTMRGFFTSGPLKAFISECALLSLRERELMYGVTNLSGHGTPVTKHLMRLGFCGTYFGKHCPMYPPSIFLLNLRNITFRLNRNLLCSLE